MRKPLFNFSAYNIRKLTFNRENRPLYMNNSTNSHWNAQKKVYTYMYHARMFFFRFTLLFSSYSQNSLFHIWQKIIMFSLLFIIVVFLCSHFDFLKIKTKKVNPIVRLNDIIVYFKYTIAHLLHSVFCVILVTSWKTTMKWQILRPRTRILETMCSCV